MLALPFGAQAIASAVTFKGVYRYASAAALEAALDHVQELLDGEDDDFPDLLGDGAIKRKGLELKVDIDWTCPRDIYYAYETIVEALAERAVAGSVTATLEGRDGVEVYPSGPRHDDE
jgi:hypothetical protein